MLPYRKCVAIIVKKNDLIFSAERLHIKGAWQLPQGGVEKNETYIDAAKRELYEETSIHSVNFIAQTAKTYKYDFPDYIQTNALNKYGKLKYRGQEQTFVLFDFFGEDSEINLKGETEEFSNWKWAAAKQILNDIVIFKSICYKKAFSELNLIH